ncbi:MAG: serine hydrolase [Clostridia bacterium]|nr:serine hydrolase [Clostridia bacterium]
MDLIYQTKGLRLINRLFSPNKQSETAIPFYPQKPCFAGAKPVSQPFERVTPEEVGIDSARVNEYIKELMGDKSINLHGITLIRKGKIFFEADFGLYRSEIWHAAYSMSKTVVSIAIGIMFDEGLLSPDDRLVDLLDAGNLVKIGKGGITVKELLTMSTGISFNELGAVTENDWAKGYFESKAKFEAGERFEYNSMNSYILSCIIKKVAGVGVNEYLEDKLWKPLGIDYHPWETCPKGIEKGGWGLYLRREDTAKLGVLIMNGGVWKGKRLLSEKYINLMLRRHRSVPAEYGGFDYGCHIWTGRSRKDFLLNGMFGQNVLGFKGNGVIIASNGGNDEVFQRSPFFKAAEKYFGSANFKESLPPNKKAYKTLCKTAKSLCGENSKKENPFARIKRKMFLKEISGREYNILSKNGISACLLPVTLRAIQNNYGTGIKKISFLYEEGKFYIDFVSPDGIRRITAGFERGEYTLLNFNGEKYVVGCLARLGTNEDGVYVLTLNCAFCETASQRIIKFYFSGGGKMRITFSETPGVRLFDKALEIVGAVSKNKLLSAAGKRDLDYLRYRIKATFDPEYTAEQKN